MQKGHHKHKISYVSVHYVIVIAMKKKIKIKNKIAVKKTMQ